MTATVEETYPIQFCGPAGLALGPKQDLFVGCNKVFDTQTPTPQVWDPNGAFPAAPRDLIIDAKSGQIDATILGVGAGDEVWFNPGDGNYYATGSGSPQRPLPAATAKGSTPAGVIDAKDQRLVQLFPTYNVPAGPGHPAGTSHSIAANSHNNLIFVPLPANNAVTATSPDGKTTIDCTTGCIPIFGHPDEDVDHGASPARRQVTDLRCYLRGTRLPCRRVSLVLAQPGVGVDRQIFRSAMGGRQWQRAAEAHGRRL